MTNGEVLKTGKVKVITPQNVNQQEDGKVEYAKGLEEGEVRIFLHFFLIHDSAVE